MMFEWKLLMAAKKLPFSQKATTYTGNIKVHTIRGVKDCILYVNSYLCVCLQCPAVWGPSAFLQSSLNLSMLLKKPRFDVNGDGVLSWAEASSS